MSKYIAGGRVFKHALTLATTLLACAAIQAVDDEKSGNKAEKFIQKASQSAQMEIQVAQLAQQKSQNQEVKNLAAAMTKDHTAANQKLQQIAQQKNIQVSQQLDQKHQGHLTKLQSQSGAEFDKEFVKNAIKHHKKDIAEYEKCSRDVQDAELKAYIDATLPTLRQHLQMAQSAATSLGLDPATIAADIEADSDEAIGAPAEGERGKSDRDTQEQPGTDTIESNSDASTRPQTSADIDANVDTDDSSVSANASVGDDNGKIFEKGDGKVLGLSTDKSDGKILGIAPAPGAREDQTETESQAQTDSSAVGGPGTSVSETSTSADIDAEVDTDDASVSADADVDVEDDNGKIFEKGDGKVLGLSTDKNDGKILGIFPAPGGRDETELESETEVEDSEAVGGPGTSASGKATSGESVSVDQAPVAVKQAIRSEGGASTTTVKKMTVYEAEVNGKTIHVTEDGKVYKHGEHSR